MRSDPLLSQIQRLKRQIQVLKEMQIGALTLATYVGMTPELKDDFDARRKQITELMNRLLRLQRSQSHGQ